MSSVAIVRALLVAAAPILGKVPQERIFAGEVRQGTVLPAIGISEVSANEIATVARATPRLTIRSRVQVTIHAKTYADMKNLIRACRLGGGVHTGVHAGYQTLSVVPEGVNPEMPVGTDEIFEQSRDFMVTFTEAN